MADEVEDVKKEPAEAGAVKDPPPAEDQGDGAAAKEATDDDEG